PVLWSGLASVMQEVTGLVGPSRFKGAGWRARPREASLEAGQDPAQIARETDPTDLMEGLYVKVEEGGCVVERYKYVRTTFLTAVVESGSHWLQRPIVPNLLAPGTELFA